MVQLFALREARFDLVRRLAAEGVQLVSGSDAGVAFNTFADYPGPPGHPCPNRAPFCGCTRPCGGMAHPADTMAVGRCRIVIANDARVVCNV